MTEGYDEIIDDTYLIQQIDPFLETKKDYRAVVGNEATNEQIKFQASSDDEALKEASSIMSKLELDYMDTDWHVKYIYAIRSTGEVMVYGVH